MIRNSGISFGISIPGINLIATMVLVVVIYFFVKTRDWGLGLIALGGGLNLGERIISGFVTDYWKIPLVPLYNNVNDWLIVAGVIVFLWNQRRK